MALYDSADITIIRALTANEVSTAAAKDTAINNAGHTGTYTLSPVKNFVTVDGAAVGWTTP